MLSAVVLQTLSERIFISSKLTHWCGKDYFFQLENLWTQRLFHFFTYCLAPSGRLRHRNISARYVAFAVGRNLTWAAFADSECSFHNTITYPDIRTLWLPLAKFVIWIYWVERRGGSLTQAFAKSSPGINPSQGFWANEDKMLTVKDLVSGKKLRSYAVRTSPF